MYSISNSSPMCCSISSLNCILGSSPLNAIFNLVLVLDRSPTVKVELAVNSFFALICHPTVLICPFVRVLLALLYAPIVQLVM